MFKLNNENQIIPNKSLSSSIKDKFSGAKALNETKHYTPATKEWVNSVYFFNKDFIKTIPAADNAVNRLIKSYFSISPILNKKKSRRVEMRFKRLSLNRILVSKAEMKHTNNKVVVTVYLYNKNKKTMLYRLKNLYKTLYFSVNDRLTSLRSSNINKITSASALPLTQNDNGKTTAYDSVAQNVKNIAQSVTNNKGVKLARSDVFSNKKEKNAALWNSKKTIWKKVELNLENSTMSNNQKTSLLNSDIVKNIKTKKSRALRDNKILGGLAQSVKGSSKLNVKSFAASLEFNNKDKSLLLNNSRFGAGAKKNTISLISQLANVNKNRFNLFFSKLLKRLDDSQNTTIMPLKDMYLTLLKKSNVAMLSNKYKFYSAVSSSGATRLIDNEFNPGYIDLSNNMQTSSLNNSIIFNYNYSASNLTINKTKHAQDVNVNSKFLSLMDNKHSNGLLIKLNNLYKLFVLDYLTNSSANDSASRYKSYESIIIGKNSFHAQRQINDNNTREERLKLISAKSVNIINKVRKYKNFLLRILRWNNNTFANYENKYYKKFFKKVYRKEFLYLYYTKMLSFNNIKFKNWFLLGLKRVLSNIYKKRIEFNFVNLKYLHLNSDIFSESIAVKLRNRQNRLLTVLKKALNLVKLSKINNRVFYGRKSSSTINNNDRVIKDLTRSANLNGNSDSLNTLLQSLFTNSSTNNNGLDVTSTSNNFIESGNKKALNSTQISALDSIKHKAVFGVRLEAAGRLSKRLTASRSVFKLKYKGSLKNIDSSYHGLSSTMLRGNTKSNLQYTKVSSKTRNGAFGLKGWVSGY